MDNAARALHQFGYHDETLEVRDGRVSFELPALGGRAFIGP